MIWIVNTAAALTSIVLLISIVGWRSHLRSCEEI